MMKMTRRPSVLSLDVSIDVGGLSGRRDFPRRENPAETIENPHLYEESRRRSTAEEPARPTHDDGRRHPSALERGLNADGRHPNHTTNPIGTVKFREVDALADQESTTVRPGAVARAGADYRRGTLDPSQPETSSDPAAHLGDLVIATGTTWSEPHFSPGADHPDHRGNIAAHRLSDVAAAAAVARRRPAIHRRPGTQHRILNKPDPEFGPVRVRPRIFQFSSARRAR